ncbi:hypothetical protein [Agrobacterium vitis]|uniref:hypothetical protein n=1 Tax=Agrobacterium vitis TaxID=373 RepID=UPI000872FEF3|nr:hypothetical protein [Agrobacterium vitis]MUO72951.1 hypothetical protein [Agrobacterium vitis]
MGLEEDQDMNAEIAYVIWSNSKQAWMGKEGFHARLEDASFFEQDQAIEICKKAVNGKIPLDLLPLWYEDVHHLVHAFYDCVNEHP